MIANGQLDATRLAYFPSKSPKAVPAPNSPEVLSHNAFTDHMITVTWTQAEGWSNPKLVPYGPLQLPPSASVFQYATACYEGMKVFRGYDGKLRLFRPELNCQRMQKSAHRISLPQPDPAQLLELIKRFCAFECRKWLPRDHPGSFLYLRPTLLGTDSGLGFEVPTEAKLVIFGCYWPLLNPTQQDQGLKLLASKETEVRAWPNGTGFAKVGANYGPALLAHSAAKRDGYNQVLWLLGSECQVTEAGSTNFFVIWRTKDTNKLQMVTAPLDDGVILAGITRQSILDLSRERFSLSSPNCYSNNNNNNNSVEPLEVLERPFTMSDIIAALEEGRLESAFSAGTAFFVNHVSHIHFRGRDLEIPTGRVPHLGLLRRWITEIMYRRRESAWTQEIRED